MRRKNRYQAINMKCWKTEISFYKKGKYALFVAKFVIISSQRSIQGVFYQMRVDVFIVCCVK